MFLFVVCCCSCVTWRCCGFRCPRAHKEMRQVKSQASIQKTTSRPSFDAVEKYVQNSFDASRFLKKHTKGHAFPQTLPLYKNRKNKKPKACPTTETRSVKTPLKHLKERQHMEISDRCLILSKEKRCHTGKILDRPSVALELSVCNPMFSQKRK